MRSLPGYGGVAGELRRGLILCKERGGNRLIQGNLVTAVILEVTAVPFLLGPILAGVFLDADRCGFVLPHSPQAGVGAAVSLPGGVQPFL